MSARTKWFLALGMTLAVAAMVATLGYRTEATRPEWVLVANRPTRAVQTTVGDALLVPSFMPGSLPEQAQDVTPSRLGPTGAQPAGDECSTELIRDIAGDPLAWLLVGVSSEGRQVCFDVIWAAGGPLSWDLSPDRADVALTDARNHALLVYDAAEGVTSEIPLGDPQDFLALARSGAPEGWSLQWVCRPRWLGDGSGIIFASNRNDIDWTDGLSLWLVTWDEEVQPLWLASSFGSGAHLMYLGESAKGYLVYEGASGRLLVADTLGGDLLPLLDGVYPISLSPDGRWLAVQPLSGQTLESGLAIVDVAAPEPTVNRIDVPGYLYNGPVAWSASSNRLAYLAPSIASPPALAQLVVVDLGSGEPTLTLCGQPGSLDRKYPLSWASGDQVMVVDSSGRSWLVEAAAEGGGE